MVLSILGGVEESAIHSDAESLWDTSPTYSLDAVSSICQMAWRENQNYDENITPEMKQIWCHFLRKKKKFLE